MKSEQSESRFYMWRAVVAMAHADGVVTPHEISFIRDYINDSEFSKEQLDIVGQDLINPQCVADMFFKINISQDKKDFFALARALSWCDGNFDAQEKAIIDQLESEGFEGANREALLESREAFHELELNQDQWNFTNDRSKNLLGFLKRMKIAA